jgi:pyruvate,water dikinase
MTSAPEPSYLPLEPPGPGSWLLDPVHFPRPVSRYWTEMHPEPFVRGFSEFTEYYGTVIGPPQIAYVGGFSYGARPPLHPDEIPKRLQRAEEVFPRKVWRDQLKLWDETLKPASIKAHKELQSVDPDQLSDAELVSYLERCRSHHSDMIYQHMRFTGAAMLPIGDLLVHVGDWTGMTPAQVLGMMRGASPVSGGGSAELDRLIATVRQDARARDLLESEGDPGKTLDELRALDSDAGAAISAYLDIAGYRLLDGFDITNPYALELPDALLRAISSSVAGRGGEGADVEELVADVRAKVPDEHRAEFNELLDEARLTYRFRDERGVYSDIWASGIMRRAALAGGRRLTASGRISDPEHFIHAGFDEMRALLTGDGGPSDDELAERYRYHLSHTAKEAPPFLGDPPSRPPDPSGLPPGAQRVMRAMGLAMSTMFGGSEEPHTDDVINGIAASGGVYEGPARRVRGPVEFERIVKGDVLLTESTTEAFNILLPLLGAIITDSGGLLSHSAIVAREYGIPGVVGTRDATERIADGARVRVDGDAGAVTVL